MERGLSCGLRAWLAPCDQPMPLTGCDPHPLAVLLVLYVTKTDCALTNKRCRLGPRGPPNRARGVRLAPREGWEGPLRCGRVQTCYSGGYVQSSNACARLQLRQLQRCSAPPFLGAAVRLAAAFTRHPLRRLRLPCLRGGLTQAHLMRRCMGKSLNNFLAGRDKFSPKKKRVPIHEYLQMVSCGYHDHGRHRPCIGPGCKVYDAKIAKKRAPSPCACLSSRRASKCLH